MSASGPSGRLVLLVDEGRADPFKWRFAGMPMIAQH